MRATGLATMLPVALLLFACVETAPTATPALSFSTEEELRAALVEIDRRCREEYEATIAGLTVSGIAFGGPAASIGKMAARSAAQERLDNCRAEYDRVRAEAAALGLSADPRRE